MCSSDRQQGAQVHSFTGCGCGPLLHFVGSVRLVFPDDGQRVGLSVEDPVVEREVVVVGEQQVEIPVGDTQIRVWNPRLSRCCAASGSRRRSSAAEAKSG